jgi:hypothetical protein
VPVAHQAVRERQEDRGDARFVRHARDLGRGLLRLLRGHEDAVPEARIGRDPGVLEPVVVRRGDHGGGVGIDQRAEPEHVVALQDRVRDPVALEQLVDHDLRIRARHQPALQPRVAAHAADRVDVGAVGRQLELRRVRGGAPRLVGGRPEEPARPRFAEVRPERVQAVRHRRMDVAVDDADRALRAGLGGGGFHRNGGHCVDLLSRPPTSMTIEPSSTVTG